VPKRLSPERSRIAAIEAARDLLIQDGPQAVTLKAVAARIGRTHANLLHHFGSAAGLQKGDVVTRVNGQPVTDGIGLIVAIRSHQPGETLTLTVKRAGRNQQVRVKLDSKVG
jgi:AcrR family transcriptional regulator